MHQNNFFFWGYTPDPADRGSERSSRPSEVGWEGKNASYPSAGFVNIKISKTSWYLRYFRYFQKCTCQEGRAVKY